MTNFQWDTEDDNWNEIEQAPETQPRSLRVLLLPLGIVLLIALGGYAIYDRITDTVGEVTAQTESEIRATVKLMYERAAEGDTELFGAMLSGRDREWAAAQQWMMGGDGLLDRSAFGLTLVEEVPQVLEVALSPGLDSAEITTTVRYQNALSTTVELNLPIVMRKGNSLWLYAPSWRGDRQSEDEEFVTSALAYWGKQVEDVEIGQFEISYFERDEAIVRRLVADLNRGYSALCTNSPTLCYENRPIFELHFTPEPTAIYDGTWLNTEYKEQASIGAPLGLPTPSIVGLPTDEASYRALLYGYAGHIFKPALLRMSDYGCCLSEVFAAALVERMLIDAGLKAELLSAEIHLAQFDTAVDFEQPFGRHIGTSQQATAARERQHRLLPQLLARFVSYELQIDLADGLNSLQRRPDFDDWVRNLLSDDMRVRLKLDAQGNPIDRGSTTRALRAAYGRYMVREAELIKPRGEQPPVPYPDAIVGLSCQENNDGLFVRWDVAANTFDTVYSAADSTIGWNIYHPASNGFVFEQRPHFSADNNAIDIMLLNQSGAQRIPTSGLRLMGLTNDEEQNVLLSEVTAQGFRGTTYAVNPSQCDDDNCPMVAYDNRPIFSPNGKLTLQADHELPYDVSVYDQTNQLLFERRFDQTIAWGVFWVSDSAFAYRNEAQDQALIQVDIFSGEETLLLNRSIIADLLAQPQLANAVWVNYWRISDGSGEIFVSIQPTTLASSVPQVMIYDLNAQSVLFSAEEFRSLSAIEGNTQYLVGWQSILPTASPSRIVLIDRANGTQTPLPIHNSRFPSHLSGEWFLQTSDAYTLLFVPKHNYVEFVQLPEGMTCQFATPFPD